MAAGRRAQTQTTTTEVERLGSLVLDFVTATLAQMDRCPGPGETRNRGGLASGRLSLVLALPNAEGATADQGRGSGSHPPYGGRVEDWRRVAVGLVYLLLPVSVGSASLIEP